MAKRSAQNEDPLKALEDALRLDLEKEDTAGLTNEPSLEDLEAQVASAAAELAKPDTDTKVKEPVEKPAPARRVAAKSATARLPADKSSQNKAAQNQESTDKVRTSRTQNKPQSRLQKRMQPAATPQKQATSRPKAPLFAPANDDSRDTRAAIMRSIDGKGGRSVRITTYSICALWVIGGLGFTNLVYGPDIWRINSSADLAANPGYITSLLAVFFPVLIFIAFGLMIARAQEMRSVAKSMAELAVRLFEPETMATDNIMRVGQAVRREVSAINEGIERTIARASELETLVHSEINALEHSYSDNEVRLRSLVEGLSNEREVIVSHSERVRASIVSAHEQLREELETAGDQISSRLTTSGKAWQSFWTHARHD